jgi:hypothetical protein
MGRIDGNVTGSAHFPCRIVGRGVVSSVTPYRKGTETGATTRADNWKDSTANSHGMRLAGTGERMLFTEQAGEQSLAFLFPALDERHRGCILNYMAKSISITCKTKDFLPLDKIESLQGELKKISPASMDKLKNSIKTYGFSFPVFVWESGKRYYSIDGVHRCKALKELAEVDGYGIPEQVPVVFINAKNRKHAKELLLAASSNYAVFDQNGMFDFIADLNLDDLKSNIEIKEISLDEYKFENKEMEISDNIQTEHTCPKCGYEW